ncbi:hypothetical protein KSL82_06175 [Limosilactobacillus portuensis]|jgi:predicted MPP superfamily phosphohydrolase|uniref:Tim44-like domain-containing protein n=1 Tax=Limosilactobacillus portuensis TaxID=2742601 RepID=A0ABS6IVE7_9LACO|nr:hypothetical protein [Limosilactobacillus portuensis]MBU9695481.1 hypothetical protein [Limosilactobacillus portuensis]MDU1505744.1 hypothetical protein [Limosilactobacillus vaginalis]PMC27201.1 hypothetical protein CJ225_07090 [Gardnerella vaginalis]
MKRVNLFKRWKIALVTIITKLLTFHAAFASMGSTGGGGSSSSGGGSSSSGSSIISSGHSGSGDSFRAFLFVLFFCGLYVLSFVSKMSVRLYRRTRDIAEVNGLASWMLIPNMKIKDFKQGLKRAKIRLENDAVDDQLAQILVETYAWAQFVYGQSIRRCFADSSNYLDQLKSQLGRVFLSTMHDEIIAKASNGIIDDVLVSHGRVVSAQKISPDLIIAKVQVSGIDSEVNVISDFNSSFKRQQWTDYVVFGRKQGSVQWRIYNIVYGAHFHLNGEDFNHQQSLDISGYTEEHLEVSPELVKSAEAYKKRFNQRKNVKAVVRWVGFVLGLLFVNHILG